MAKSHDYGPGKFHIKASWELTSQGKAAIAYFKTHVLLTYLSLKRRTNQNTFFIEYKTTEKKHNFMLTRACLNQVYFLNDFSGSAGSEGDPGIL